MISSEYTGTILYSRYVVIDYVPVIVSVTVLSILS